MNIHEYQAKAILADYGVTILKGAMAETLEDAVQAAEILGGKSWVVKAQIHAGGRGKAGGIKLVKSRAELEETVKKMLGMRLITHQTGSEGKLVKKIYLEETAVIKKEYYLGIVLDRAKEMPVIIASTEGGVEIEKVAAETPEKIVKVAVDPLIGFRSFHARELGFGLGLTTIQQKSFSHFVKALYQAYYQKECSLIEINPLILNDKDEFIALDAKMGFDDNALFRHQEIRNLQDLDEEEPSELEAGSFGLNYIKLEGNVGCMVNGAGLAMSTMDIIKHEGGEPANFLDVGGAASAETVAKGFEIILRDPGVKAIFVNIFGGIVRCDRIARGILDATGTSGVQIPLIIRLDGTNSKEAVKILQQAKIDNIITASDLADGARKAVKAAGEMGR